MLKLFSCQEFSFTTLSQLLALPLTLISIWLISWTFNTELPLITIMVMCLDNVKLTSTLTILPFLLHRFVWRWNFVHLNIQVMCLDIHPDYPNMIAIGLYDGNVAVSDYQMFRTSRKVMPIFEVQYIWYIRRCTTWSRQRGHFICQIFEISKYLLAPLAVLL